MKAVQHDQLPPLHPPSSILAFTRLELLALLGILVVLASLLLPYFARAKFRASRIKCINNLKNVGLAYRIFANDNNELFPFQISVANGGTRELTNDIVGQFQILSNELSNPIILICPTRVIRQTPAQNWTNFTPQNISYYISLTASESATNSLLAGDAGFNLNNTGPARGLLTIIPTDKITYPKDFHTTGKTSTELANIVLSDGSVHQLHFQQTSNLLGFAGTTNILLAP